MNTSPITPETVYEPVGKGMLTLIFLPVFLILLVTGIEFAYVVATLN